VELVRFRRSAGDGGADANGGCVSRLDRISAHRAHAEDRVRFPHPEPRARSPDHHAGPAEDDYRVGGARAAAAADHHVRVRHHQRSLFPHRGRLVGFHRQMPIVTSLLLHGTRNQSCKIGL